MDATRKPSTDNSLSSLTEGILSDVGNLIAQHFDLLGTELKQELKDVGSAALSLGTGTGAAALAGMLGTVAVVELVHDVSRLPRWACYGLAAGLLGAAGAGLLTAGVKQAGKIDLIPRQTAQVLKEELAGSGHG